MHHCCNEIFLSYTDLGNQLSVDLFSYKRPFLGYIPNLQLSPLHIPQAIWKSLY